MYQILTRGVDTDIYLTRGDTFMATVTIIGADGQPYVPASGDVVRFAAKLHYTDQTPVIQKEIQNLELIIESGDTADLEMGVAYVYDIQLTTAGGDVYTFVKGRLYIGEEVE